MSTAGFFVILFAMITVPGLAALWHFESTLGREIDRREKMRPRRAKNG